MNDSNINVHAADSRLTHRFPWKWRLSDLNVPEEAPKVFSCFSCGGGSTMGYKLAGFRVIGCCDIDEDMIEIYRANHHPGISWCCDIRDLISKCKDVPEMYDLDILDGSPPCSTFSMAGERENSWGREKVFREGQKKQRLDDLFFEFIKVAKELQPKIVVAENVAGLLRGKAKGYIREIFRDFDEAGYDTQLFLLNSAVMGVPQKRERVFFIGRRKDLRLPAISLNFNEEPIPFGSVRSERGKPVGGIAAELLKHRQMTDCDLSDISKRIRRKAAGFAASITRDDRVAYTITSGGVQYRMCDGMGMTDEDYIACQTFPQDYDFGRQSVKYVCGMSVPPVMMANIAAEIKKQVFETGERDV